ncbi:hypothetical protein SARC_11628 [Sphaeroforma arctica JP610]|uniref:Uncharacterized protein n=1 Tax=Sphaeroforma arctica JP610 TaxID=667725 RepID=A0A0L0FGG0_9EUKA|nr:hypothetical protein SARC_11628 [Sphaeroforma arctica JP610]KNC75855.1 hypothetical protein SARC_11628 [Sphaeroforma arctica JP610]|eukprot:XP_014149757.1 hypothetical protein SARC_11628 [Sphaeroforma arctica JP610]
MTHMHDARSNSRQMPEKDRLKRVKLSMARIKVVIGERDRSVKAIHVEENNEGVKRAEKRKAKFAVYQEALRKRAEKNLLKRGAITTNGFVEKSIRLTSRAEKATHAKRNEAATATPTETTTTSQKEKSVDEKASTAEANVVKKTGEEKN